MLNFMEKTIYKMWSIIFLFIFIFPCAAQAERLGIAVNENKIAFDMDASEEQTFVIKITNISDQEQKIVLDTLDYDVEDNNHITLRADADWQNGLKEWVTVPEKEFTLQPNMGKDVRFTVRVPETATVGSHRGAMIFRTVPNEDVQVKVQGQIGVHVLINVKGDTHATGKITMFDVPFITWSDVAYRAEFENTGNIHYVPHGEVLLRNVLTNKRVVYNINEGDHFVLPGKKVVFEAVQKIPSVFGVYLAQARFVDGEGSIKQRNDLVMGALFPVFVAGMIGGFIFSLKKIRSKKRGTPHVIRMK